MKLVLLLALLFGAALGLYVPDIDQAFAFLLHRSILTHGVLIPLGIVLFASMGQAAWQRCAVIGLCSTLAVHLCFDLFPVSWLGFALISIPLVGRVDATLSILWLVINTVAALYLALALTRSTTELAFAFAVSLSGFLIAARGEHVFWVALLLLLGMWVVAACLPQQGRSGLALARRVRP